MTMLRGHHYQNAYVTRDLAKAIANFRAISGIEPSVNLEVEVQLDTPAGSGVALQKLALFWVGDLQYEFIEPISGLVEIYREGLPAGDGVAFHHIAMRVDNWEDLRSAVGRQSWPLVHEGGSEHLRFLYLDARETLGHYVEYAWMTPERWTQMGGP
jgi:hypothetical protein